MPVFLRSFVFLLLTLSGFLTLAQGRLSPEATVFGIADQVEVSVSYSKPSVRGRKIWGNLVPFDKIWRAGANEATVIEFTDDVLINGKKLPLGRYAFFVIPKKDGSWIAVFNSDWDQWGAFKYDSNNDVLRVTGQSMEIPFTETLRFDVKNDELSLSWENKRFYLSVARD